MVAERLLAACRTEPGETIEMLAEDMVTVYSAMRELEGLPELPWRDVGAELRRLTGGRKTYKWVVRDGERHRLRVYVIAPAPADSVRRRAEVPDLRRAA